jgi:hypothetical protein
MTCRRAAVGNLSGPPPLDDALLICLLLDQEPDRYEHAAARWLGRLLLEHRGVSLRHAELAAAYLGRKAWTSRSISWFMRSSIRRPEGFSSCQATISLAPNENGMVAT